MRHKVHQVHKLSNRVHHCEHRTVSDCAFLVKGVDIKLGLI
jgi:hypothetical protein